VPGTAALAARRQASPVVRAEGEYSGSVSHLPATANAAALPPHSEPAVGGHQPGQPTNTAALPRPGGEAPASTGTASPPSSSFTGQHDHPTWSGATHPHSPAQAFHAPAQAAHPPAPAFHPPAPAFHPPAQVPRPPAPASHVPAQAAHPPAQAFHAPAQAPQSVAHPPPAARGGRAAPQAPKGSGVAQAHGGGGKGDKHD
jgi:hypothetical protein